MRFKLKNLVAMRVNWKNVKNKANTSKEKPIGFNSWIDFWENKKNQKADVCKKIGCFEKCSGGAHVIDDEGTTYIVPLCSNHNHPQNNEVFAVFEEYLVPIPIILKKLKS